MEQEELELIQWLRRNHQTLLKYGADEIAYMAIQVGFSRSIVFKGVINNICQLQRKAKLWENPLFQKWVNLSLYEKGK